jgi:hypothetical protein
MEMEFWKDNGGSKNAYCWSLSKCYMKAHICPYNFLLLADV